MARALHFPGVVDACSELGAHPDCDGCQFYDLEGQAGELCAMEGAVLCDTVTPELARLFGWTEDSSGDWIEPDDCPWFAAKDLPSVPFDDPAQFDAFAGPMEESRP